MSATPPGSPPAGWYPDPNDASSLRYWDGSTWTDHRAPATPAAPAGPGGAPYGQPTAGRPPLADFGARLVALIIDALIVSIPIMVLGFILFFVLIGSTQAWLGGLDGTGGPDAVGAGFAGAMLVMVLFIGLSFMVPILYQVGFEGGRLGQTIGKWAMNIRVVEAPTAGRVAPSKAFIRSLVRSFVSGAVLWLGYLWMLWDDQNRTWHDMAADTRVVVTDRKVPFGELMRSWSLRQGSGG